MSEDQDKPVGKQEKAEPEGPRGGELLAAGRREQQISVLDIAKELHLDEAKVRALERNEFDLLGAPVFAKGHLRKYAELVGIDPDDVLEDYYKLTRQEAMPPVVVARRRMRREISPGPWVAAIVVILVAAAAYWWFAVYSSQLPAPQAQEPAPQQQNVEPVQTTGAEPVQRDVRPETEPVSIEPESASERVEPEPASEEPPVADNEVRLSLVFSGDCWTEISDATGRRLFFQMGRAGDTVNLSGVAPFAVLLGNVDNVAVQVDGSDYPLRSTNPGGRTARLTIMTP
jgi:cytoskeleton protein RodZ